MGANAYLYTSRVTADNPPQLPHAHNGSMNAPNGANVPQPQSIVSVKIPLDAYPGMMMQV